MNAHLKIQVYGEKGVLITWPNAIDEQISNELLSVKKYLSQKFHNDLVDISNGYQSLLLYFNKLVDELLIQKIHLLLLNNNFFDVFEEPKIWNIPVCYNFELGVDLEAFLQQQAITLEELVVMHTTPVYHVYCKGFLPGFLYLGGLNKKLHLQRKHTPNLRIPKNSVAIGGEQTGIYPCESPGGWHVIGRTPITLFAAQKEVITSVNVGDKVKFNSISKQEFLELEKQNTL